MSVYIVSAVKSIKTTFYVLFIIDKVGGMSDTSIMPKYPIRLLQNVKGHPYVCDSHYEDRAIPRAAGFRWDGTLKVWATADPKVALRVATEAAVAILEGEVKVEAEHREVSLAESRASASDADIPCPVGYEYLPYQKAGIQYGLKREATLFGDEMGLGKTIQAIGIINADPTMKKILVICPASLRLNWQRELRRWLVNPMLIEIATSQYFPDFPAGIVIINYDIVGKHHDALHNELWDCVILDEAHYLKNYNAKRTLEIVGKWNKAEPIKARKRLALTGTPIPNRPIEGFPVFHWLAPKEFKAFGGYAKQFCNAGFKNGHWDATGNSNLPLLQTKLRSTIMVRRLKADVLTELPPKRRCIIEFRAKECDAVVRAEKAAFAKHEEKLADLRARVELSKAGTAEEYKLAVARLREEISVAFQDISRFRHATAVAKIPFVIDHIRDIVEAGQKVIVFAHHLDVIKALAAEFKTQAVSLYGDVTMTNRQAAVDRFQKDDTCRVFIGGIMAAGVGITLTASSHVVFAELDWVPGNVTQAEDRAHRIGQRDMVLVEHLVLEDSLDAKMARTLVRKQEVIDRALDHEDVDEASEEMEQEERRAAAVREKKQTTRQFIDDLADKMTRERIAVIHAGLRILASRCDGALRIDGHGFSGPDVRVGHDLADTSSLSARQAALGLKLVITYRRQIPDHAEQLKKELAL